MKFISCPTHSILMHGFQRQVGVGSYLVHRNPGFYWRFSWTKVQENYISWLIETNTNDWLDCHFSSFTVHLGFLEHRLAGLKGACGSISNVLGDTQLLISEHSLSSKDTPRDHTEHSEIFLPNTSAQVKYKRTIAPYGQEPKGGEQPINGWVGKQIIAEIPHRVEYYSATKTKVLTRVTKLC